MSYDDRDWQAEDDARTLMRAHQIKQDPDRHAKAKAHARNQVNAMKKVAGTPGPAGGVPKDHPLSCGYRKL